jgi:hypothetical protein
VKILFIVLTAAALGMVCPVLGQFQNNTTPQLRCEEERGRDDRARHCEMREQTVPFGGQLTIDGHTNGGVSVIGENRNDVLVRMKIEAWAENDSAARAMASAVRVDLAAGRIGAQAPNQENRAGWAVSYEIFTPVDANLTVKTHNGGIRLSNVRGNVEFSAVNGGVHLNGVSGNVSGKTTNGGVHVQLAGDRWNGQGLEVKTTNGGVHLNVPANYSAHLEASTVNGGFRVDYPVAIAATPDHGKRLSVNLGAGGAPIRCSTTNGGVSIKKI